jgi:hypothetical protein
MACGVIFWSAKPYSITGPKPLSTGTKPGGFLTAKSFRLVTNAITARDDNDEDMFTTSDNAFEMFTRMK